MSTNRNAFQHTNTKSTADNLPLGNLLDLALTFTSPENSIPQIQPSQNTNNQFEGFEFIRCIGTGNFGVGMLCKYTGDNAEMQALCENSYCVMKFPKVAGNDPELKNRINNKIESKQFDINNYYSNDKKSVEDIQNEAKKLGSISANSNNQTNHITGKGFTIDGKEILVSRVQALYFDFQTTLPRAENIDTFLPQMRTATKNLSNNSINKLENDQPQFFPVAKAYKQNPAAFLANIFESQFNSMLELHKKNLVHADARNANTMMRIPEFDDKNRITKLHVALIDVGMSKDANSQGLGPKEQQNIIGPMMWYDPSTFQIKTRTFGLDDYSLKIDMYEGLASLFENTPVEKITLVNPSSSKVNDGIHRIQVGNQEALKQFKINADTIINNSTDVENADNARLLMHCYQEYLTIFPARWHVNINNQNALDPTIDFNQLETIQHDNLILGHQKLFDELTNRTLLTVDPTTLTTESLDRLIASLVLTINLNTDSLNAQQSHDEIQLKSERDDKKQRINTLIKLFDEKKIDAAKSEITKYQQQYGGKYISSYQACTQNLQDYLSDPTVPIETLLSGIRDPIVRQYLFNQPSFCENLFNKESKIANLNFSVFYNCVYNGLSIAPLLDKPDFLNFSDFKNILELRLSVLANKGSLDEHDKQEITKIAYVSPDVYMKMATENAKIYKYLNNETKIMLLHQSTLNNLPAYVSFILMDNTLLNAFPELKNINLNDADVNNQLRNIVPKIIFKDTLAIIKHDEPETYLKAFNHFHGKSDVEKQLLAEAIFNSFSSHFALMGEMYDKPSQYQELFKYAKPTFINTFIESFIKNNEIEKNYKLMRELFRLDCIASNENAQALFKNYDPHIQARILRHLCSKNSSDDTTIQAAAQLVEQLDPKQMFQLFYKVMVNSSTFTNGTDTIQKLLNAMSKQKIFELFSSTDFPPSSDASRKLFSLLTIKNIDCLFYEINDRITDNNRNEMNLLRNQLYHEVNHGNSTNLNKQQIQFLVEHKKNMTALVSGLFADLQSDQLNYYLLNTDKKHSQEAKPTCLIQFAPEHYPTIFLKLCKANPGYAEKLFRFISTVETTYQGIDKNCYQDTLLKMLSNNYAEIFTSTQHQPPQPEDNNKLDALLHKRHISSAKLFFALSTEKQNDFLSTIATKFQSQNPYEANTNYLKNLFSGLGKDQQAKIMNQYIQHDLSNATILLHTLDQKQAAELIHHLDKNNVKKIAPALSKEIRSETLKTSGFFSGHGKTVTKEVIKHSLKESNDVPVDVKEAAERFHIKYQKH